ncbi:MAG: glycosyltransferase [Fretibacterium sp.]|mgnify:CR=1 FL=1|nr:glycosyltransferase [Fretibacterium sp.]
MGTLKLSVIIITLNEERNLPLLLGDLERQTVLDFETLVVDSCSLDKTVARARSFSKRLEPLRIIEMPRRGVSLGRNTGALEAQCERILFLDADTRLDPDFIENCLSEMESRCLDVGGVYMKNPNASLLIRAGLSLFNLGLGVSALFFPMAVGACVFSTRTLHGRIGGFDESITLCEDCDYVRRASGERGARFGMLRQKFVFHTRRLEQDGLLKTGWTYLRANLHRFFIGELYGNPYRYQFGHYSSPKTGESDA